MMKKLSYNNKPIKNYTNYIQNIYIDYPIYIISDTCYCYQ